jgi:cysteine synthase A
MELPNKPLASAIEAIGNTPLVELARITKNVGGYRSVTDDRAIQMARRLAREEGIFAGFSAGANVTVAMDLLHESFKDEKGEGVWPRRNSA